MNIQCERWGTLQSLLCMLQAAALGLLGPVRGRGRGRGVLPSRGRGRGRGGSFALSNVVDRRPKQLLVVGFMPEEKDAVASHLSVGVTVFHPG